MPPSEKDFEKVFAKNENMPPWERAPEGESINNSSSSVQKEKKTENAQTEIPVVEKW